MPVGTGIQSNNLEVLVLDGGRATTLATKELAGVACCACAVEALRVVLNNI